MKTKRVAFPDLNRTVTKAVRIPLSFNQERLWFIDQLQGSVQYHIPVVLHLSGPVNVEAVEFAFRAIVKRHEVLRTVIRQENNQPYQLLLSSDNWALQFIEYNDLLRDSRMLQAKIEELINTPFQLFDDYMLRVHLINIEPNEYTLIAIVHHIASDGWSMQIMINEWIELYTSFIYSVPAQLKPLPFQYSDYSIWQREYFDNEKSQLNIQYWRRKLEGVLPLSFPYDQLPGSSKGVRGASVSYRMDKDLIEQILQYCVGQDCTPFMFFMAAFKVLLFRYSGQDDICVGVPTAGRLQKEVEALIGFFNNTIPIRSTVNGNMPFSSLLQVIKEDALDALDRQEVPFERIVREVMRERDHTRSPIFQVMFDFQTHYSIETVPEICGIKFSQEPFEVRTSKFDLTLSVLNKPNECLINLEYSSALFKKDTIVAMGEHYKQLIRSIIQSPDEKVQRLNMMSGAEFNSIINSFKGKDVPYPGDRTIVDLFKEQCSSIPDVIAIIHDDVQITYRALDDLSSLVGQYLYDNGVKRETPVPILLDRSIDLLISILAVLKAGGAYVPIDSKYPHDRIRYMLRDIESGLIITSSEFSSRVDYQFTKHDINMDVVFPHFAVPDDVLPYQSASASGDLAYIMYTSGSTGVPKGVMVEHRNVVSLVRGVDYVTLGQGDILLSTGPPSFDASTFEYWGALLNGGRLILMDNNRLLDTECLKRSILAGKVTTMWFTSSWFNQIVNTDLEVFKGLKTIVVGGEKLSEAHIRQVKSAYPLIRLVNGYGPTENTTFSLTYHILSNSQQRSIPIGQPLNNRYVYILDDYNSLCPVNVAGEICVFGAGLFRGYLNNPELVFERLIRDPYGDTTDSFVFKTGDQGRWLTDGNVIYLGRQDDQVKIRGYRIELGEIEAALLRSGLVLGAAVIVRTDADSNKTLVSYVVPALHYDEDELVRFLKLALPEYMIPAKILQVQSLPLTPNGKVNKDALPGISSFETAQPNYRAPCTPFEHDMVRIWQDLLNISTIGIDDNFFELGGDSIISIQVVNRMRRAGYDISVIDLFENQSIAALSDLLKTPKTSSSKIDIEEGLLAGECDLLPIQHWFLDKHHSSSGSHFNQSVLLEINKQISEATLGQIVKEVLNHHNALRFSYSQDAGRWKQSYGTYEDALCVDNCEAISSNELSDVIEFRANQYQRSLDTEKGELIRVVLFKTASDVLRNRLLIIIHHLAVDGVSWRILLEHFETRLSESMRSGGASPVQKTTSYRQYANAINAYAKSDRLLKQRAYWTDIVGKFNHFLFENESDETVTIHDTAICNCTLDKMKTECLIKQAPKHYDAEVNDLLLYAIARTLCVSFGTSEVIVGLEGHGREDAILSNVDSSYTVGWFTTLYPVLFKLEQTHRNESEAISSVKEAIRKTPDRGIGYGVLKYIVQDKGLQCENPWDIVFNYLGQIDNVILESEWLSGATESSGDNFSTETLVDEKISVSCLVQGGKLQCSWRYSTRHFNAQTIDGIIKSFLFNLEVLIEKAQSTSTPEAFTDLYDSGLIPELDPHALTVFLNQPVDGKKRKERIERLYALSGLQKGILFHGLYNEDRSAYVEQFSCDLTGIDCDSFVSSWDYLVKHHSILRTTFHHEEFQEPVQCVHKNVKAPVTILDYTHLDTTEQERELKAFHKNDYKRPFDFSQSPLMRISLIRLDEQTYRFIWTFHHIIMDGWSQQILIRQFFEIYNSFVTRENIAETEDDKFEDYIRHVLHIKDSESFWKKYMSGLTSGTLLPFIQAEGRNKDIDKYTEESLAIDGALSNTIKSFARKCHITVNTIMQGVWAYLLYRQTGKTRIVYGITTSGRPSEFENIEDRVGLYINTLPFHVEVFKDQNISTWLEYIQAQQWRLEKFQYTSLNDVQKIAGIQGDLFDSILIFQNFPISTVSSSQGSNIGIKNLNNHEQTTNYPLVFRIGYDTDIYIQLVYKPQILDHYYIRQILRHFEHVLAQFVNCSEAKLNDIEILTDEDTRELMKFCIGENAAYPNGKSICEEFLHQVSGHPDSVAVSFEDTSISYSMLQERSVQICEMLHNAGARQGDIIAVCLDRSIDLIASSLSIIRLGCTYAPIEPQYPQVRINRMLSDSNCQLVIGSGIYRQMFEHTISKFNFVNVDDMAPFAGPGRYEFVTSESPACIFYTSGSMGTPKGVVITHNNILSLVKNSGFVNFDDTDILLSTGSPSFDATIFEYWGTVLNGGHLVLLSEKDLLNQRTLCNELRNRQVNKMWFTSSWFNQLVDTDCSIFDTVKTLVVGGEKLSEIHIRKMLDSNPSITIINGYGPTENTTFSLTYTVTDMHLPGTIPIGRPLNNRSVYILNDEGDLNPVGVAGEICLGGAGVAEGYLNMPELTHEKFIWKCFDGTHYLRIYRSGDRGKLLPNGAVQFLGRFDDQVKIRGFRIELSEIEAALVQSPLVKQAFVIFNKGEGIKGLIAYIVPNGAFDQDSIQGYLRQTLPDYMMPLAFVALETVPLTSHGKVDKKALRVPLSRDILSKDFISPRTDVEKKLAGIWSELLAVDKVGVNDNFFSLGGDSIKVIGLVNSIRELFGKEITFVEVYQAATLQQLAQLIGSSNAQLPFAKYDAVDQSLTGLKNLLLGKLPDAPEIQDIYPMTDVQMGMGYASLLNPEDAIFHDQVAYSLTKDLNIIAFKEAFSSLVAKHEILRTRFDFEAHTVGIQILYKTVPVEIEFIDYKNKSGPPAEHIEEYLRTERGRPFSLTGGQLWRASLVGFRSSIMFVFQFHHAIFDGWSIASLNTELNNLYLSIANNVSVIIHPLKCTYRDFTIENLIEKDDPESKEYWRDEMMGFKYLDLFTDDVIHQSVIRKYNRGLFLKLRDKAKSDNITLKALFLGAWVYTLKMLTYDDDITVSLIANSRPARPDGDKVLGCFLNTIPFRFKLNIGNSWQEFFTEIENKLVSLKKYEKFPLTDIIILTQKERVHENPFSDVVFNFTNFHVLSDLESGIVETDEELSCPEGQHSVSTRAITPQVTNTYLDISVDVTGDNFSINTLLRKKLRSEKSLDQLLGYFESVLERYLTGAHQKINSYDAIPLVERNVLINKFNDTDAPHIGERSLLELIEEQETRAPENIAVVFENESITYQDLGGKTNALAYELLGKGVKQGSFIPVLMSRGIDYVVSFLAILKTGTACVPLSIYWPLERLRSILSELNAPVVLANEDGIKNTGLNEKDNVVLVSYSQLEKQAGNFHHQAKPDLPICIFYTSGAEGTPKGVVVSNKGILNRFSWMNDYFGRASAKSVLRTTRHIFDSSLWQLFWPLTNGGTTVIPSERESLSPEYFSTLVEAHGITMTDFVPSFFEEFINTLECQFACDWGSLKDIIIGGEQVSAGALNTFKKKFPSIRLTNLYGPTEASIGCIYYNVGPSIRDNETVPIGTPISNTRIYILDKNRQMVAIGVPGEIYISGRCLALGYFNDKAKTQGSFVPNIFSRDLGFETMYKTGDMGRWLPNGNIEFIGRLDSQVKIHGYRIELTEIEHALKQAPGVKQAIVVVQQEAKHKQIVGYVVMDWLLDNAAIRRFLQNSLPDYMIPSVIIQIDRVPLTMGGKADIKSLPKPDRNDLREQYAAPVDQLESRLADIWKKLLSLDVLGTNDNFFTLGGHSLLLFKVASGIKKELGVELTIKDLFIHPTISRLSQHIRTKKAEEGLVSVDQ